MPERFELTYTGADNAEHRPVMIHRALLGSMERFAGILIEHYGGRFPLWLAPVQAVVLPVADRHNERAARGRRASCGDAGFRVRVDERTESVGKKIRDAELAKAPYMLVVGDQEIESGAVSCAPTATATWARWTSAADRAHAGEWAMLPSRAPCESRRRLYCAAMPGTHTTPRR